MMICPLISLVLQIGQGSSQAPCVGQEMHRYAEIAGGRKGYIILTIMILPLF